MNTSPAVTTLARRLLLPAFLLCATTCHAQDAEQIRGEPGDATAVREQIAKIEKRLPQIPDRAAALYVLAALKQHIDARAGSPRLRAQPTIYFLLFSSSSIAVAKYSTVG